MRRLGIGLLVISLGAVMGCETLGTAAQDKTVQGGALGAALGAGTGAILGNQMGHHAGAGTAIGAGIGALAGGLIGHGMQESQRPVPTTTAPAASTVSVAPLATTTGVKFCPVGGESYADTFKYCPVHGVELKYRE